MLREWDLTEEVVLGLREILLQYKGGGYDGCFWEWNFAWINKEGEFQDIFSSGRNGCSTMEKFKRYAKESNEEYAHSIYGYDLTELPEFVRETQIGFALMVAKWIAENVDIHIVKKCDRCVENFVMDEMENSGYEGCGGVAIQMTGLVCEECLRILEQTWFISWWEDNEVNVDFLDYDDLVQNRPELWALIEPHYREELNEGELAFDGEGTFEDGKVLLWYEYE